MVRRGSAAVRNLRHPSPKKHAQRNESRRRIKAPDRPPAPSLINIQIATINSDSDTTVNQQNRSPHPVRSEIATSRQPITKPTHPSTCTISPPPPPNSKPTSPSRLLRPTAARHSDAPSPNQLIHPRAPSLHYRRQTANSPAPPACSARPPPAIPTRHHQTNSSIHVHHPSTTAAKQQTHQPLPHAPPDRRLLADRPKYRALPTLPFPNFPPHRQHGGPRHSTASPLITDPPPLSGPLRRFHQMSRQRFPKNEQNLARAPSRAAIPAGNMPSSPHPGII